MLGLRSPLAALFLIIFAAVVLAAPRRSAFELNNADRFKRGLPPKTPRKLFDASKVDTAARAKRSGPYESFTCQGGNYVYAFCCATIGGGASGSQQDTDCADEPASQFPSTSNTCDESTGQQEVCCEYQNYAGVSGDGYVYGIAGLNCLDPGTGQA